MFGSFLNYVLHLSFVYYLMYLFIYLFIFCLYIYLNYVCYLSFINISYHTDLNIFFILSEICILSTNVKLHSVIVYQIYKGYKYIFIFYHMQRK